jgi:hypothetical protein
MAARVKAGFVEPMLLLRTDSLPDPPDTIDDLFADVVKV